MRDEVLQIGMKVKLLDGRLERSEQSDGESAPSRRLQDVDPAAHPLNGAGEVSRSAFQKILPLRFADDVPRPGQQPCGVDRFTDRAQRTADAQREWQPGFQMQIAGALLPRHSN